jgi:NADH-quinone oxidoreductase subunit H
MKRLGGLLPVFLAIACCWLLSGAGGCMREASPQLVRVSDVAPREVEPGDRMAIVGEGFPPGREARVTFRGTLHRPGEKPETEAEIVVDGVVAGPEQVEIAFSETTQAMFCRVGDRAAHTTFEGDLEVAFAAATAGTAPVAGTLRHVVLDVRPSASPADVEQDREGERLLAWVGLQATAGSAGLTVASVEPGSRAEAAGISPGDTLASFDGVRVGTAGDVVPASGEREATIVLRRAAGTSESTRTLAVDGLRRAPPADLVAAALIALSALALVLVLGAPARPALAAPLQRLVSRMRAGVVPAFRSAVREALPPAGPLALVDALVYGLLAAMPFGQYLVAAQLDVGLLFVAAATALTVAALLSNRTALRGLKAAAHVALQHVPPALAVVTVVATTGSLRMQEIARTQGGWPWDWLAFRSPGALVALALLVACCRIEPDGHDTPATAVAALVETSPSPRSRGPWLEAACRAHRVLVAGLASALFLGGWLLPGLTATEQAASPALQLAGATWLLAKTWGVVLLMIWSTSALPEARLAERTRNAALWLVPASFAALLATAAWTWWSPVRAAQLLVSGSLVALVVLVAAALAHRVRHGLLSPLGDGRVSPFL